jgi:hypothetical protein
MGELVTHSKRGPAPGSGTVGVVSQRYAAAAWIWYGSAQVPSAEIGSSRVPVSVTGHRRA